MSGNSPPKPRDIKARAVVAAISALLAASPVAATPSPHAAALDAMLQCRSIADSAARLACFDHAMAVVADLVAHDQVQVVDSETLRQTRRSLFGFQLPSVPLLAPDKPGEQDNEIDATISSVREIASGQIEIRLNDGAVWRTTEAPDWGAPKPGSQVHLRRGMMGGYFLTFKGQHPVRGMRVG